VNNGALSEQWCANFLIIDKAFWVLDLESIVLYRMVAMSNILQSSLSSCWRVLLQTFLSPDNGSPVDNSLTFHVSVTMVAFEVRML